MLATSAIELPSPEQIRALSILDIAVMSSKAHEFRDSLLNYISIDSFTTSDPFEENSDNSYYLILDSTMTNRIVAIFVTQKDSLPQLPWNKILSGRLVKMQISRAEAIEIKNELAPKDTNNFYPYRRSGRRSGYCMFAFQICGQR